MNGVHDLGGMHGMGPVEIERNEPVFHADWEKRVFALRLAAVFHRKWNIDMNRYAIEVMPPAEYLAASYYERVLYGFEKLLVETGLVSAQELAAGSPESKAKVAGVLRADGIGALLSGRIKARREEVVAARFKTGETVVTRNTHPHGHTRLPRYARGRRGVIDCDRGVFVFPDTNAMTRDPKPQHMYSVRFSARELWGADAPERDSVYMSLWDDHLEPA